MLLLCIPAEETRGGERVLCSLEEHLQSILTGNILTAEVQLMCSQASQLLAEIPFRIQPTAWLRGLLSPRNRDAFGGTGPEAAISV